MTNKAKAYKVAECLYCKRERAVIAQGLCGACYKRLRTNGTLEKQRKRSICTVDGCDRIVKSHGMCELHWDRTVRAGDPLSTLRPDDWGQRRKHPLYHRWQGARKNYGVAPAWEDFWQFVRDVGETRPSGTAAMFARDLSKALGPDNYEWREPQRADTPGAQAMRRHIEKRGGHKGFDLHKRFGITLDDYQRMHDAQGGVCWICQQPSKVFDKRLGKVRALAVDHCHATGKVRGLLCQGCNQALGNLQDSPERLRRAIDYLASHGVT